MNRPHRDRARGLALRGAGLFFIGALGLCGCGSPAAGAVQVTPAERERILPHAGGAPQAGKEPTAPPKVLSIKQRKKG